MKGASAAAAVWLPLGNIIKVDVVLEVMINVIVLLLLQGCPRNGEEGSLNLGCFARAGLKVGDVALLLAP